MTASAVSQREMPSHRSAGSQSGVKPPHSKAASRRRAAGLALEAGPLECGGLTPLWLLAERGLRRGPLDEGSAPHPENMP